MKAVVFTGDPARPIELGIAPDPRPAENEALVSVRAFSVNRGDAFGLDGTYGALPPAGFVPGSDLAGVVVAAAADGSGPAVGTRIVGRTADGAWAEQVAVPTAALTPLPEAVDATTAAALPLAGITALRLLRAAGDLANRRLLLTGAGGGVGHFVVELAATAGARVCAVTSSSHAAERLLALGAEQVVTAAGSAEGPFDVVMESVGGQEFSDAASRLAAGGTVVWFGQASKQPVTLDFFSFFGNGLGFTLRHFANWLSDTTDAEDLGTLTEAVAAGRLHPEIGRTADWADTDSVLADLMARKISGNAVLTISGAEY